MFQTYWPTFVELLKTPFEHIELVWGIVPLYFGWMVNELTSPKASFRTAVQTGFSFLWAGAHWVYQDSHAFRAIKLRIGGTVAVNWVVTGLVITMGLLALYCGLRHRFPKFASFLGHTRFANYFMIAIFPIQSNYLEWSWDRMGAIALFAVPLWVLVELLVAPLHTKKGRGR